MLLSKKGSYGAAAAVGGPRSSRLAGSWRKLGKRQRTLVVILGLLLSIEWIIHQCKFSIPGPPENLRDKPFFAGCQEPDVSAPRENAVVVMLARNSEVHRAVATLRNFELRFNRWFHYPIVFLNDEHWGADFIRDISQVASGNVSFESIPRDLWGYPSWIDGNAARESMKRQERKGVLYGGMESYHQMCRFHAGKIYDHPALQSYKWYWRVDSDLEFLCDITYDPFVSMAKANKRYGYAMALWEVRQTVPNLFRVIERYKNERKLPYSSLYAAMTEASWFPIFLRKPMSWLGARNDDGDVWNLCHFWTNFEIADMEFFRGKAYRDYFDHLDRKGGFYFERWGDAPVHSLGAALLLPPEQVHYFEDMGYMHDNLQRVPANRRGAQLLESKALEPSLKPGLDAPRAGEAPGEGEGNGKGEAKVVADWDGENASGVGCRCKSHVGAKELNLVCTRQLLKALR